jgi:hypothetical protein
MYLAASTKSATEMYGFICLVDFGWENYSGVKLFLCTGG